LTSPENEYVPVELAVVVAVAAPLRATVAALPPAPLIVPEIVYVTVAKFTPVRLALLTVAPRLAGVKVKPDLLGVTVYAPLASPENVKVPVELAVVVADPAPLSVTVAALPPRPLIVPEMLYVTVAKFTPVTLALLTVALELAGVKAKPLLLGVTVYAPLTKPENV
jgi:hypothetical protein